MSDYGHFTTMRVEPDGVRGLARHAERLRRDAAALFDVPLDPELVRTAAAGVGDEPPYTLRLAVTAADHDLARPGGALLRVTATARAGAPRASDGLAPLRLGLVEHVRALPRVKHLGLVPELWTRRQAQREGYDDALFVDAAGRLGEGPTWSLLLVAGSRLVAPAAPGLPSVTVALLAQLREVETADLRAVDLRRVDAAIAVNAGWGVRRIASLGRGADAVDFALDSPMVDDLTADYTAFPRDLLETLAT